MKIKIYTTAVVMSLSSMGIMAKAQNSLTVNISNIKAKSGYIVIGLFNSAADYLKTGKQYKQQKIAVRDNIMQYTFNNLPVGDYSVALYHDENGDNQCNKNMLGIPKEHYGFSNNIKPVLSAPSFNQTKIALDRSKSIMINLL